MPKSFHTISMHMGDEGAEEATAPKPRAGAVRGAAAAKETPSFNNDESAARYYLSRVFDQDKRAVVRGLTAPARPEVVPDLKLLDVRNASAPQLQKGTRRSLRSASAKMGPGSARLVRFEQTRANVPVFGARAVVELDANRNLVSIDATVASIGDVSHIPAVSVQSALARTAAAANVAVESLKDVEAPTLTFYNDKQDRWHLAYLFRNVSATPQAMQSDRGTATGEVRGRHGLGRSPRELRPRFHFLIDAHDGEVLLYYSANPLVVLCRGIDDEGQNQRFYGSQSGAMYEMFDSLRSVRTFDLNGGDLDGKFPKAAIRSKVSDPWVGPAAVSAHVNATRVQQFFGDVLGRHGIDDKGMELVSVVNCTYTADQAPPEWHNAVWYDNRMWYGRMKDGGALRSYARYLDIIGHELMHGVTEKLAGLVYRDQSGALDESVSDIFGVIINNWYRVGVDSDVGDWTWEIGPSLGDAGKPLRDMSNPKRTGDPVHMKEYDSTMTDDNGGVHTYSNIHNLAAYYLLNAKEGAKRAMLPSDVAVLYYLALQRLGPLSVFSDMRRALVNEAKTYFGKPDERKRMVGHIERAYDKVGIS